MILFTSKAHKRYLLMVTSQSIQHDSLDSVRVTLSYFALSGLDILNGLDKINENREKYIDWYYSLQSTKSEYAGFQNGATFNDIEDKKWGHIAATYSALNCLLILGDDLSRVDKKGILQSLRLLQLDDGSFMGAREGTENDMRFVYCAAAICYILDDWSGMDVDKSVDYVLKSISYDGGIGQGPQLEAHGGSSFCAIATLVLTGRLPHLPLERIRALVRWIVHLQKEGFQGRPNKVDDTCYAFWLGATLKMLGAYGLINKERLLNFVLSTQDFKIGGLSKWSGYASDPLHTYMGLAGLSVMGYEGLSEIMPALNITLRTYKHLKSLHEMWRSQKIA